MGAPSEAVALPVLFLAAVTVAAGQTRQQYEDAARALRAEAAIANPGIRPCLLAEAAFYECTAQALGGSGAACTRPTQTCTPSAPAAGTGTGAVIAPPVAQGASEVAALQSLLGSLFNSMDRRAAEKKMREAQMEEQRRASTAQRAELGAAIEREMQQATTDNAALVAAIEAELAAKPIQMDPRLSNGLAPAFSGDKGEWSPWYYLQGSGGSVIEFEVAYWYGEAAPSGGRDFPVQWAIRSKMSRPVKLTYEIAVQCYEVCTGSWQRFEVLLEPNKVVHVDKSLRAFDLNHARVVSVEWQP
jgi:hypothetical protein